VTPLFLFTYTRFVPTGQIGIFKRCMRMVPYLADRFDLHLINYGPLPETDALFSRVRSHLTIWEPPDENLGMELVGILRKVRPQAVVIGETPLRGSMRLSHRVSTHLRLPQICLENYYGSYMASTLLPEWPHMDYWILLGLSDPRAGEDESGDVRVAPPFVEFPPGYASFERDRVCVIGYDKQTVLTATLLLKRLPTGESADFFIAPQWRRFLERHCGGLDRERLRILELPTEADIYDSMARAKFVFGKAGFQQVVEGAILGSPVICRACGGGLEPELVPAHLRPYFRFIRHDEDLPRLLFEIAGWLLDPPSNAWADLPARIPCPAKFGADLICDMVARGRRERDERARFAARQ
jgi:hypothetical protein